MTVFSIAYPFAPVGPDATGGAEQILSLLDRGLTARGHRSLVAACEGSHVEGELIPLSLPSRIIGTQEREFAYARLRETIASVLGARRVNIVHMHGVDFHEYLPSDAVPVLGTLHLPPSYYPAAVFQLPRLRTFLNCVSLSQLRACPRSALLKGAIPNGIALDSFATVERASQGYVFAMGRICPEKGFHLAARAATRAGAPLRLAGAVFPYPEHERYFREQLLPELQEPHRFLGPLAFQEKITALAGARCLLVPSLVPETSSLVAMEAMACGTPVVAFDTGALHELVEPGRTGFLVNDVHGMCDGIKRAGEIDPETCRRRALERFPVNRMVGGYVRLYAHITGLTGAR